MKEKGGGVGRGGDNCLKAARQQLGLVSCALKSSPTRAFTITERSLEPLNAFGGENHPSSPPLPCDDPTSEIFSAINIPMGIFSPFQSPIRSAPRTCGPGGGEWRRWCVCVGGGGISADAIRTHPS